MRNKLLFVFVGLFGYFQMSSQTLQREVLNTAGKTNSSSTLILTNNIGETAINTYQNGFTLREGFLQPDDSVSIFAQIFHVGNLMICANDSVKLYSNTGNGFVYQWFFNGFLIPGANDSLFYAKNTGTYKVRISVGNDYSFSFEKTVIVRTQPQFTLQYSRSQICQGDSVLISGTGAKFYLWNNGSSSSSITIKQTGVYSFIGTDSFGCSNTSPQVSIRVNQPIVPNVSANGPTNVCNTNVTLFATNAIQYNWNTGATTSSINATSTGNYWVITTDSNGCIAKSNEVIVKKFTTVPDRPIVINGDLNPCLIVGTGNTLTYSIPLDTNTTSYSWLLTNGITAVGNVNENIISVTYPTGFSTGQIRATPNNACGEGLPRAIYPKSTPVFTTPIFTQVVTSVCNIIGTSTSATYSIRPITGCTSYQWSIPNNATLIAGQGTNSIQLTFSSGFVNGNISVFGVSPCGNSPTKTITVSLLGKPEISGIQSICPGDLVTYTTPIVSGAIRYRFNLPNGLTLVSQNLNSAVITNTGAFVSGNLGVQVQTSACGWSQPGTLGLSTVACRFDSSNLRINLFPNPSRGEFQMQLGTTVKSAQISVFSADGRLIKRQIYYQIKNQTLYYNDVAEGLYHLEIVTTDAENNVRSHNEKIMIQR